MNTNNVNLYEPKNGWNDFYKNLVKEGAVPNVNKTSFSSDGTSAVFRGNFLELSTIQDDVKKSAKQIDIVTIYTDILHVSKETNWILNGNALVIYARKILIDDNVNLSIVLNFSKEQQSSSLMVFSTYVNTAFSVSAIIENAENAENAEKYTISSENISPGVLVNCNLETPSMTPLKYTDGFPELITEEEENYLNNSFILGALCSVDFPEIAVNILKWVSNWAKASVYSLNSADLDQLFFKSANLASLLNAEIIAAQSGATYVPYLSSSVYKKFALDMVGELKKNQENYISLFSTDIIDQSIINTANVMLNIYKTKVESYDSLLKQSVANYEGAIDAEQEAIKNFSSQKIKLIKLKNELKYIGIPEKIREEKIKSAFSICKALVEFGVGIAAMAVGQEEVAPAAVEESIVAVKDTVDLVKVMKGLAKLIKVLNKINNLSQTIYRESVSISSGDSNSIDIDTINIDNLKETDYTNTIAAWSVFNITAASSLAVLIQDKFKFAQEYKTALDVLTVYGKTLSATQLASIKASQKVVALRVKKGYAIQNVNRIKKMISSLQVGGKLLLRLKQLFYQEYLNSKLTLFSILKSYQSTYYYWALQPSNIKATLNLETIFNGLNYAMNFDLDEYEQVFKDGYKPQEMNLLTVDITALDVIEQLKNTRETSWILNMNNSNFSGLNRVRFDKVRIWIMGDEGLYSEQETTRIVISMKTSGTYNDRILKKSQSTNLETNQDEIFLFNSDMLEEGFIYEVSKNTQGDINLGNGLSGKVIVDGTLSANNQYFRPTPFTEWSIDFPSQENIDINKITKITMQFSGTTIIEP